MCCQHALTFKYSTYARIPPKSNSLTLTLAFCLTRSSRKSSLHYPIYLTHLWSISNLIDIIFDTYELNLPNNNTIFTFALVSIEYAHTIKGKTKSSQYFMDICSAFHKYHKFYLMFSFWTHPWHLFFTYFPRIISLISSITILLFRVSLGPLDIKVQFNWRSISQAKESIYSFQETMY